MNFTGCIECGSMVIENKALHLCASCSHAHRKSLRDSTKALLKGKPKQIARVSDKKKEKLKPYAILRRNYLKENPICESGLCECANLSEEIHHCSMSELDFLEVTTWKAVCKFCHHAIEFYMSAEERRAKGLLVDSVNTKWEEPHKI